MTEADEGEDIFDTTSASDAATNRSDFEILSQGESVVHARRIERDSIGNVDLMNLATGDAKQTAVTAFVGKITQQATHRRSLAGAVSSEQAIEVAGTYIHVDSRKDGFAAELDLKLFHGDRCVAGHGDWMVRMYPRSQDLGIFAAARPRINTKMVHFPYRALTFDCFGTLMDWRRGQAIALQALPELAENAAAFPAIEKARLEAEQILQAGPWLPYREILARSITTAAKQVLGITLSSASSLAFADAQAHWPPYDDSVAALKRLAVHTRIGLLSNCDDAPLRHAAKEGLALENPLLIPAEAVRSYKPDAGHWDAALRALGCRPEEVLHVSAYAFYDLVPAHRLGFSLAFLARDEEVAPTQLPLAYQARDLADLADQLGC